MSEAIATLLMQLDNEIKREDQDFKAQIEEMSDEDIHFHEGWVNGMTRAMNVAREVFDL